MMGAYEIGVACEVKPIHGAGVRESYVWWINT
jgi:hypothetical protein